MAATLRPDRFLPARAAAAVLLLGVALQLGACAGRPPPALAPVAEVPANIDRVDMLVASVRRPVDDPALMFGGARTLTLRYADLAITLPPNRTAGEIAWSRTGTPDPLTSFAAARARYLDEAGFRAGLGRQIARTGRRHVLVFVHGFNTRFDEAAFRFAQIVKDSDAPVTPVLFSWSSWGTASAYPYDRTSAQIARTALEQTLDSLARDPRVSEVTILAHSMGGWLTMEALRQMGVRQGRVPAKIGQLMLASPDIDVDEALEQVRTMGERRPKMTLIISRDDRALGLSRFVWGSADRLGSIDPNAEPYRSNLRRFGVDVLDLTDVPADSGGNHAKFANTPQVVRLIGARVAAGQTLHGSGDVTDGATNIAQGTLRVIGNVLTAPLSVGGPGAEAQVAR
jgi:esterase/lipase superfamily enzyme